MPNTMPGDLLVSPAHRRSHSGGPRTIIVDDIRLACEELSNSWKDVRREGDEEQSLVTIGPLHVRMVSRAKFNRSTRGVLTD